MAAIDQSNAELKFLLNDKEVAIIDPKASDTLIEYLRLEQKLVGTKEGCAEGDCGACTVLVGRLNGAGDLVYETVNSCIRLMGSLQNCHVITIEYLKSKDGSLHPVQQAMVEFNGSQCGFCTPGIVMSLYGLWLSNEPIIRAVVMRRLQGNLCRCTGYEPILQAALSLADSRETLKLDDPLLVSAKEAKAKLLVIKEEQHTPFSNSEIIIPQSLEQLTKAIDEHQEATLIAGSTDVGLWVNKQMRNIAPAIFINQLEELRNIEEQSNGILLGGGVTYSEALPIIVSHFPELKEFWPRIGGEQVRNMGTIGGNIANGSPIGDTPPALIPLGASITLKSLAGERTILLEDFFIDYGKQDRQPNEIVASIFIPYKQANAFYQVHKISKRKDEDISALCGGFLVELKEGKVASAKIAFGGMAATPKRAKHMEAELAGKLWNLETIDLAIGVIEKDFKPLSDWRASADYRLMVAGNLLKRFYMQTLSGDILVSLDQLAPQDEEDA